MAMASLKHKHLVVTCRPIEIPDQLDEKGDEYDLISLSVYQAGTGFGARPEAVLAFRLREPEANGNGHGRRKFITPISPRNKSLDS